MIPVLFINCLRERFVDWIIGGLKLYETRTRNTLKKLLDTYLGERILIAETGRGDPLVRCSAVIDQVIAVGSLDITEDEFVGEVFAQLEDEIEYGHYPSEEAVRDAIIYTAECYGICIDE